MMFAKRRNRVTTHFSEGIPIVKWCISVYGATPHKILNDHADWHENLISLDIYGMYFEEGCLRWRSSLRHCGTSEKAAGLILSDITVHCPHYGAGFDLASTRSECQEYLLWLKTTGAYG